MFYWVDAPPSTASNPNGLVVRFKMLRGVDGHFQSGYLSVANGTKRAFNRVAMGDYLKGGYFEWSGKIHFFVQWAEPKKLVGNIVSMAP